MRNYRGKMLGATLSRVSRAKARPKRPSDYALIRERLFVGMTRRRLLLRVIIMKPQ